MTIERCLLIGVSVASLLAGRVSAENLKPLFQRSLSNLPGKSFTAVEIEEHTSELQSQP